MRIGKIILLLLISINLFACAASQQLANQSSSIEKYHPIANKSNNHAVVLLHGLNRTSNSMRPMAKTLQANGYQVCNIDYPSRYFSVSRLANNYVLPRIMECVDAETQTLDFVTHSLGGIIIRSLDQELQEFPTGRFVMLSPPNQGSEAVDKLTNVWGFRSLAGPAGASLGTAVDSVPNSLPVPTMPFAIIAAKYSNSPMSWLLPGDDDGKVTIERMQLEQMQDFLIINNTHSFMMRDKETIQQVMYFLQNGFFVKAGSAQYE